MLIFLNGKIMLNGKHIKFIKSITLRKWEFIMSEINPELKKLLSQKEEICNALENLAAAPASDYQSEIKRLSDAYAAVTGVPPEFAELLDKRFDEAVKSALAGESAFIARQQRIAALDSDVDTLLAADEFATLGEVEKLEKNILELIPNSPLLEKLAPLKSRLIAEENALKATEDAVNALTDELEKLTALEDLAPLHDRKPEIETAFAQLVNIPRKAAQRYQDAHRKASVKIAQHYETLDLARWESYTRKLDLCAELDALLALPESEMSNASKKLNEIREQWKNLGSVPKEKSEEINPRYLELTRQLQHKVDEFFARKRQTQKLAAAEKEKLCAQAEELQNSTDWKNTAAKMRELQAQWKQLPRAGNHENELFQRFHAAADTFFNARKTALDARDQKFKMLEERKRALVAEAENLTDARRARQLREEFRTIGFCGKMDQELYLAFNTAMDNFFNARKEANTSKIQEVKTLLEEVKNAVSAPAAALPRIREIREQLRSIGCRDTRKEEQAVLAEFDAALNEFRRSEQLKREQNSETVALELAQALDAWKNGGSVTLPAPEVLNGYTKFQTFANTLNSAVSGDSKAAEKLDKLVAAARDDRERICAELEKLAGCGKQENAPLDLAQELQFAMLGNFGKNDNVSSGKAVDPQQLCADFANAGIVPADELTAFQKRFNTAKEIVFKA